MTDDRVQRIGTSPLLSEAMRIAEALIFAAPQPVTRDEIAARLPAGADFAVVMARLEALYGGRGVQLARIGGGWTFQTAPDLAHLFRVQAGEPRRLSRAAMEMLAIIAYHQPVTRAEIEDIRGVSTSKGTLDVLLESGWVRMRGRRRSPGRPVTYGTTPGFLVQFGLDSLGDMPGLDELKGAGFLDGRLPAGFSIPIPSDDAALHEDEDPLDQEALEEGALEGDDPGLAAREPLDPLQGADE